jgi:hypothetical protein
MFDSVNKVLNNLLSSNEEKTEGFNGHIIIQSVRPNGATTLITFLITIFFYLAIISAIGMYLWNNIVVKLISFAKPAKSMWQILGLLILTQLLFN